MQKDIRLIILTANSYRHKFLANHLVGQFNVLGVVSEEKRPLPEALVPEENKIIKDHKKEIVNSELKYFGDEKGFNLSAEKIKYVQYDNVNGQEIFEWIKSLNPDCIAIYGTSIIKPPILNNYENRIINMHLGLSPYYRGSGTNFWPLVFGEPECVGATIHLAIKKVDAGAILRQIRPEIEFDDGPQDIGNKTIIAGAELMTRCIDGYIKKEIKPQAQDFSIGKVFRQKDFNSSAVLRMRKNFTNGMIGKFLERKTERLSKYPVIT